MFRLPSSPPTAIFQTARPILDSKEAFNSSGYELSEYIAKLCLNATDGVTGQVKGKIFDHLSSLASPGKIPTSSQNEANEKVCIVSGILLSTILTLTLW